MATGWPMKTTYANGDVYSASDVNDITGTINLLGSSVAYAAGKNRILNSDFSIWQRGTSFTVTPGSPIYTTDRFVAASAHSAGSCVISRETFTAGTAPVSGYEGTYFIRYTLASTTTSWECFQKIEDVRAFAGQTMTVSFWAKSSSAQGLKLLIQQNFGSGGSGSVNQTATLSNLSTSWTRYTATFTMASISGKTIGTNSHLLIDIYNDTSITGSSTIDIWGVQVEQGSTATAFQTATGTIQGELAACQRYYQKKTLGATGACYDGTNDYFDILLLVSPTMRVSPTLGNTTTSSVQYINTAGTLTNTNSILTAGSGSTDLAFIIPTVTALGTTGQAAAFSLTDITFSSEL
jgi:hypothetical protein